MDEVEQGYITSLRRRALPCNLTRWQQTSSNASSEVGRHNILRDAASKIMSDNVSCVALGPYMENCY